VIDELPTLYIFFHERAEQKNHPWVSDIPLLGLQTLFE